MSASNPAAPEPSEIAGRYQIVKKLGAGAFGTVYKAKDSRLDRMVAIKTIRLEGLAASQAGLKEMVDRFEREARTAAKLKHPGIVTIHDYGESQGLSYIAMEFIDGIGIDHVIASDGRLSVERAAALGAQVAEALDYAHAHGVVHRDIKPANIMIEAGDRVKVTDFGIAKPGDSAEHLTMTGSLLGTPSYMSPEQARGQKLDGRSDLFSAGCVLYEMLAGKKAFRGDSITALLFKIITEEPPPLRELDPNVPEEMVRIIAKALAKAPEGRYQTGREMADELLALTRPGFVPTLRATDAPTLPPDLPAHAAPTIASAPTAHMTLEAQPTVGRGSATSSTQPGAPLAPTIVTPAAAARTAATVPPLPPRATPAPAAASRPAAQPRAGKSGAGVGLVLGLGAVAVLLLAVLGGGAWWFLSQRGTPPVATASPLPDGGTDAATPPPGPAEATPEPTQPSPAATVVAPSPGSVPTPAAAGSQATPSPSRPSPRTVSAVPPGGAQPPATEPDAVPPSGGADEYAFLDEPQGQDGRAAGEAVAQKFRSGGSSGIGSTRFARRERFPRRIAPAERPAVGTLALLMFAQEAYQRANKRYGTLRELTAAGLLHLRVPFANGVFEKQSYRFELSGGQDEYKATATPLGSGARPFLVDDTGFVRVDE